MDGTTPRSTRSRPRPAALDLLAEIVADHGPVLFHQSGGCCDGSSPMCYPVGDFIVGDRDVRLGRDRRDAGLHLRERSTRRGSTPTSSSTWCRAGAACSASTTAASGGS